MVLINESLEMKNASSMLIQNVKDNGSLRMNRHEIQIIYIHNPKTVFLCLWWSIHAAAHFEVLKPTETVTVYFYCEQLDCVNQSLI